MRVRRNDQCDRRVFESSFLGAVVIFFPWELSLFSWMSLVCTLRMHTCAPKDGKVCTQACTRVRPRMHTNESADRNDESADRNVATPESLRSGQRVKESKSQRVGDRTKPFPLGRGWGRLTLCLFVSLSL